MTKKKDPLMVAVGKVAQASRRTKRQRAGALADARAELVAARLERAIREAFDPKEPYERIREEDRERLANLLFRGR